MPASGEAHDEPLQHRFIFLRNLLVVVTAIGVESHGQQGLKGKRPAEKVPHLNGIRAHGLRQASNCRSESCRKENEDCHIQDELPHEALNHAEDGEVNVQVHQLRGKYKVEHHGEGSESVVGVHEVALPFSVRAAVDEELAADGETVECWLNAQQAQQEEQEKNFD